MRLLILCFSLLTLVSARAQHHHFLYLQADQQQPFYVKMGATVLSSSADGFLIIPRLRDSAVQMVVGFPSKKFPEYRFRFDGFRKDRGMALKDFGEKGWGLFDYQTLEIVMGEKIEEKQAVAPPPPPPPLTSDPFTVVLASVIDDPGLLATPLVQMGPKEVYVQTSAPVRNPPPPPATTVQPPVSAKTPAPTVSAAPAVVPASKDSAVVMMQEQPSALKSASKDSAVATMQEKPSAIAPATRAPEVVMAREKPAVAVAPEKDAEVAALKAKPSDPGIRKISDQERPAGRALVFVDLAAGARPDTVDVFIPLTVDVKTPADTAALVRKSAEPAMQKPAVGIVATNPADSMSKVAEANPKAPVPAERIVKDSPDTTTVAAQKTVPLSQPATAQPDTVAAKPGRPVRSNCARMASDKDLQALRKRILGIRDEDDMVAAALKDFKQRCFTTEQVRALSFVFVRQEGKYKLIDAAYPHVYDPANYGELEPLLTDKYFIHRFRALVQQ